MPFLSDDDLSSSGLTPQLAEPMQITAPVPPFSQLFDAAMRRENIVGSAAERLAQPAMSPFNSEYDPFANIGGYEDYAASFVGANSDDDVLHVKSRIDAERRRADLLEQGGVAGLLATGAASLIDPTTVLPVGGQFMAVTRSGRMLSGALRFGAAGAAGAAAQEAGLQATQATRPGSESAIGIASATVLGGVLGGAVGAFGKPITRELADSAMRAGTIYERELSGILRGVSEDPAPPRPAGGSVSAAAARDTTLEQETFEGAFGAEKALAFSSPTLRLGSSPSVETRRLAQDLAEQPLTLRKNAEGIPTPLAVETEIRQAQAPLAEALVGLDDMFVRYRTGESKGFGDVAKIAAGDLLRDRGGKLSYDKFAEAVGQAMRHDDVSDIPEVAQAAQRLRARVFDPLKDRAIAAGLLPEDVDVKTAPSYLMRVYNTEKIAVHRHEFADRITAWLKSEQVKKDRIRTELSPLLKEHGELSARIKKGDVSVDADRLAGIQTELEKLVSGWEGNTSKTAKGALARRAEKEKTRDPGKSRLKEADKPVIAAAKAIAKANTRLEDLELRDTARQIIDRIMGSPVGRLPYDMEVPAPRSGRPEPDTAPARGPLAHRSFMIPDAMIEDFLESDARLIARMYTRTMAPDVALHERFGRTDMQDQFQKIMQHYETLREGVTDERSLKRLDTAMKADLRDLAAVRDRLRGTYGLPSNPNGLANRAYHVVRDLNYLRLLGGMTISAFSDIGRTVMVHGITRVAGDGIVPMLREFRKFRLAGHEAQLSGTALDMVHDTRAMAMADMLDDYGRWSKYERGIKALSSKFGIVTLMAPWNSIMKQFTGVVSQTRSLRAIERLAAGQDIGRTELTRLASLGIGQDEAERIDAMFKTHGSKVDGVWWANTAEWEDTVAADAFRGALAKEIDAVIVTPGQERPLWMTGSATGRMIGQFRSFSMASTQRVLLTGLQRRDMATLNGAIMMTGLGMLTYYVKHAADSGPHKKELPDPSTASGLAQWVREGVDRSGLVGWLFDANNILEKATRGSVGVSRLTGQPPLSRYASRSVLEAILGPTAGIVETAARTAAAIGTREVSESDVTAVRRMIPTENLIGFRKLFDLAEDGVHRALGTR